MTFKYIGWTPQETIKKLERQIRELDRFVAGENSAIARHVYASEDRITESRLRIFKAELVHSQLEQLVLSLQTIDTLKDDDNG